MADALLALDAVSKSYWRGSTEVRVLSGASLDLQAGEFMAVWGKRGAGKTTLLRIAAGLETPDRGSVRFAGEDLSMLSERAHASLRRGELGVVRRAGPRSELSMLDYVALPLLVAHGRRAAARRGGAARRRGGPRLLLVDDPTANLGVREREEILDLLRSLVEETNLAVLMTVPDMPAALRSCRLRALSGGGLLAPPDTPEDETNVIDFPGHQRSA
jgi:ABC-type lipoprotein export system ATPase subunit